MELTPEILDRVYYHQKVHTYEDYSSIKVDPVSAPEQPENILVIQPSSIGDVLNITPALQKLREQNPEARISYIVEADAAAILENGVPDELLVARRHKWIETGEPAKPEIEAFLEELAARNFDLVFNPHLSGRSAWYSALAGGDPEILGLYFKTPDQPVLNANIYYYRWFNSVSEADFLSPPWDLPEQLHTPGKLARRLGLGRVDSGLDLGLTEADRRNARAALEANGLESSFIAVHTGSKWDRRRYEKTKWPAVIEKLVARFSLPVAFIGGPEDTKRHEWIKQQTDATIYDFTAQGDLKFSACILRESELLIGPDTATVHLAAAVECPALTLTGPRWVGGYMPRNLVFSGGDHSTWDQKLTPGQIVEGAGFVLRENSLPELPESFTISWTGDRQPNEFLRELYPTRERTPENYYETLLGLTWENLCAHVNRDWGYPAATISAGEIIDWLGPPAEATKSKLETDVEALNNWQQLLTQYKQAVRLAKSNKEKAREAQKLGQKINENRWIEFLEPVTFRRNVKTEANESMTTIVKNYLEGTRVIKDLLANTLKRG